MSALKAIGLTSPADQASGRFFFGYSFAQGEVPAGQYLHLDTPQFSSIINNTWPDGSACLAVFTGAAAFTANVEKQVNIVSRSYAPSSGTALTAASITASGASASVQFGALGSVTLAGATLVQTHYSDAQMVCCEYRAKLGTTSLSAQFFVWLFADGKWLTRATPWNGFAWDGSGQRDYIPTVTIDGVVVFDNAGAVYHHSANTWYTLTRWSSGSAITPRHDTTKLIESGLFPNYTKDVPQSANSTYLTSISAYTPGARLGYSVQMGSTGAQDQIGILPLWDAMYFVNRAEKVAHDAVVAGANAIGTYAAFHTDPTTLRAIKLSDYPTHTQYGAGQGGGGTYGSIAQDGTTQFVYEIAHHPGAGYLAAIITGDPFYAQICQYIANTCYLSITSAAGSGVSRIVGQQPRGVAWTIRSIANAARTCPTSQLALYEHNAWFSNTVAAFSDLSDTWTGVGGFKVGLINQYDNYGSGGFNGAGVPFWQHDFLMMSLGQAIRMAVGTSTGRAKALNFMSYLSNSVKWRSDASYFTYPAIYFYVIPKSTPISDTGPLAAVNANPASPADIFAMNLSSAEMATLGDNILHSGGSTGTGAGSYWDQFMCAVAYCVDNSLPGAAAGLARIQGASNYASTIGSNDRATTPVFAISPMSVTHTSTFTAVDSGAIVPTPGPSINMDSVSFLANGIVMDTNRGLGILAGAIPTGFAQPHPLLNDVDVGDPVGTEYAYEVTTPPAGLTSFLINQDGSIVATGPDGLHVGVQTTKKNGAWTTGVPLNIQIGDAGTVSGVSIAPTTATGATTFSATVSGTGSFSTAKTFSKISGGGSIDASTGAFTPPAQTGSAQTIVVRATSTQDSTKWAESVITIAAAASTIAAVSITPTTATGSIDFNATVTGTGSFSPAVTFTKISGAGSIDATTGLYTQPTLIGSIQTAVIRATSTQDPSKWVEATITIAAVTSSLTTRTVTLVLGDTAGVCANLTGLKVSFWDEASPELTTTARYQSAVETTGASGVLTFSFNSTLASGGIGLIALLMADGRNYLQPQAVS